MPRKKSRRRSAKRRLFERLRLQNVRCFRDAEISLGPRVTVIIGSNGAGKTTLVEAIASLTCGESEGLPEFPLRHQNESGEIALFDAGRQPASACWRWQAGESARDVLPEDRYLLAYGRYRRVFSQEEREKQSTDALSDLNWLAKTASERRTVSLDRPDNHLLRDLSRYLVALDFGRKSDPRLQKVWCSLNRSLREIGQGISGIQMVAGRLGYIPKIVRHELALDLRELSDGYQAFLVILFDLLRRYPYLFPELDDPLEGEATVIVDEVDLHLHPSWQRVVAGQLADLFPRTQFVLTTHSVSVVQGAIDHGAKIVTLQEKGGEVKPRALGRSLMRKLHGAEVGALLIESRLFDVGSLYSTQYEKLEKQVDALRAKIARGVAEAEDQRKLFKGLDKLQELTARNEVLRADGPFLSQLASLRLELIRDLANVEKAK